MQVSNLALCSECRSSHPINCIATVLYILFPRHPFLMEATEAVRRRQPDSLRPSSHDDCDDDDDDDDLEALSRGLHSLSVREAAPGSARPPSGASVFEVVGRTPSSDELLRDSVKLRVLLKLARRLRRGGHRLLVFSQSTKMLDIIQRLLADSAMV